MLYKNTAGMTKRTGSSGESEDIATLRALTGLFCVVCDQPLSTKDKKGQWSHVEKHSAYTCCGKAHCPFCGAPAKEKCRHLVAYRASGDWKIAGLPDVGGNAFPTLPPLDAAHLLDYSDAQKKVAFGEAYKLLDEIYAPGMRHQRGEAIGGAELVNAILCPDNHQTITTVSGIENQYYFSQCPDLGTARLRQALLQDFPGGFDRLLRQVPPGSRYVVSTIAVPVIDSETVVKAVALSPCGKRLVLLTQQSGEIWDISGANPVPVCEFTSADGKTNELSYHVARYSPDGKQLLAIRSSEYHGYGSSSRRTEVRSAVDGTLLHSLGESGDSRSETGEESGAPQNDRDLFLHGGETLLTVRGRCLRLYNLIHNSTQRTKNARPDHTILLRSVVADIAVSSDGETFATATGRHVVLWRIPRTSLVTAKPTGK